MKPVAWRWRFKGGSERWNLTTNEPTDLTLWGKEPEIEPLFTACTECQSLRDQNTELDKILAEYSDSEGGEI